MLRQSSPGDRDTPGLRPAEEDTEQLPGETPGTAASNVTLAPSMMEPQPQKAWQLSPEAMIQPTCQCWYPCSVFPGSTWVKGLSGHAKDSERFSRIWGHSHPNSYAGILTFSITECDCVDKSWGLPLPTSPGRTL